MTAKVRFIVKELTKCQEANGGQWVGAILESYLEHVAVGKMAWAPHYTLHKLFMALIDVHRYIDMEESLQVADRFAEWFDQ